MPRFLARDGRFFDRSHGEDLKQHGGTKGGELNEKTFEFKQQKYAKVAIIIEEKGISN